jgi:hypothetical protein
VISDGSDLDNLKFIHAIIYQNLPPMSPTTKNLHHFYQGKEVKLQLYLHPYCWLVSVIYGCTVILRIPVGPILKYGTSAYRHKNH